MQGLKYRILVFYDSYFTSFYAQMSEKVRNKILWTFRLIETQARIPVDLFKHLEGTNGLYEIRVQHGSDQFRIFCFFDEGKLIVLANGFQKKSQKTPRSEIARALKIKSAYEQSKTHHKPR
jgi:phage-related protein